MDLCYICKNSCDKEFIISCALFDYDERKIPLSELLNHYFYGNIPVRYINVEG